MKELHIWRTEDVKSHEIFSGTEEEFLAIKEFHCKEWRLNGRPHREDGPALISKNGYQEWCRNGKLYRDDGPAVIYSDGSIYASGRKYWYIEGLQFYDFFNQFFPMKNFTKDKFPGE